MYHQASDDDILHSPEFPSPPRSAAHHDDPEFTLIPMGILTSAGERRCNRLGPRISISKRNVRQRTGDVAT